MSRILSRYASSMADRRNERVSFGRTVLPDWANMPLSALRWVMRQKGAADWQALDRRDRRSQ